MWGGCGYANSVEWRGANRAQMVSDPEGLTPRFLSNAPARHHSTVILGLACPRTRSEGAEDPAIREGEALDGTPGSIGNLVR